MPFSCTACPDRFPAATSAARSRGQNGAASSTCTASVSKNVDARRKVLSITWSAMTRSRGAISCFSEPTAALASTCVAPTLLSAQMFARYGTCVGFSRCPFPCLESAATRCPPTWARNTGPDGLPNGVSTSTASPPSAPSASPRPLPPTMPSMGRCGDDMDMFPSEERARSGPAR